MNGIFGVKHIHIVADQHDCENIPTLGPENKAVFFFLVFLSNTCRRKTAKFSEQRADFTQQFTTIMLKFITV